MHAKQLTRALGGHWRGHYGTARCPAHDDRSPSLSIADGDKGRLLLFCHAGCSYDDIRGALPGALSGENEQPPEPSSHLSRPACNALGPLIARLWEESRSIAGTRVEAYLRGRAISSTSSSALRFHPDLRHPTGPRFPAMVSRVQRLDGGLTGLHRTYLDPQSPKKAAIEPQKAMLGPCKGGAVRLRDGGHVLVACEGIETGLSLCDALDNHHAIWAGLSASGVANLNLPTMTLERSGLLIAADGDSTGRKAANALAARARVLGWTVEVISAPDGRDFNDLAREACNG